MFSDFVLLHPDFAGADTVRPGCRVELVDYNPPKSNTTVTVARLVDLTTCSTYFSQTVDVHLANQSVVMHMAGNKVESAHCHSDHSNVINEVLYSTKASVIIDNNTIIELEHGGPIAVKVIGAPVNKLRHRRKICSIQ